MPLLPRNPAVHWIRCDYQDPSSGASTPLNILRISGCEIPSSTLHRFSLVRSLPYFDSFILDADVLFLRT